MVLQIQNTPLTGSFVPYERPPQPYTLWSAIPRGLQSFIAANATLEAITGGNELLLNLTATLPPNFAYVMADMNLTIAQSLGSQWANECNLNLQNFYRTTLDLAVALASDWPEQMLNVAQDLTTRNMRLNNPLPSFPIIGAEGTTGVQVNLSYFNNAGNAATAGTINAYCSFWQFDLEQVRKFPINSPQPTHAR